MKYIKWGLIHILIFIIFSICYMLTFHVKLFNYTGIYFYDGIIRLFFIWICLFWGVLFIRKSINFDYKDVIITLVTCLLCNMLLLAVCLVSLDRSLSVCLLCYIEEQDNGVTEEQLEQYFSEIFVEKYGMLDRRYDEQLQSGNIMVENDNYVLTDRGKKICDLFRLMGDLYSVDKRFIYPETL